MSEKARQINYPIILTEGAGHPEKLPGTLRSIILCYACFWLLVALLFIPESRADIIPCSAAGIVLLVATQSEPYSRRKVQLTAKGLFITGSSRSPSLVKSYLWETLKEVELRDRRRNLIPNYVCFKFKGNADSLILLEDILQDMDVTTLVGAVRVWAPHAVIKEAKQLRDAESIASYTELWLEDLSTEKSRSVHRQSLEPGTCLNEIYEVRKVLSGGGQGTAYLATCKSNHFDIPADVVLKEFILPENSRGLSRARKNLLGEAQLMRRIDHPSIRGEPSPKSDMYSIGGTLYFLFTGLDPEPITPSLPSSTKPAVSQAFDQIVSKSTALNESDRFNDLHELRKALEQI